MACDNEQRVKRLEDAVFGNGREGMLSILQRLGCNVEVLLKDMNLKKQEEREQVREFRKLKYVFLSAIIAQAVALLFSLFVVQS